MLVDILQQHSHALANAVEMTGRIDAEHGHLALLWLQQAQDVEQQRALAAAVGAKDHGSLALLDHEVEAAQVHLCAVGIGVTHA